MNYNHDMMHCAQHKCCKKDICYRYWLGKVVKNTTFRYATFYVPRCPVTDGCLHYLPDEPKPKNNGREKQKGYPRGC